MPAKTKAKKKPAAKRPAKAAVRKPAKAKAGKKAAPPKARPALVRPSPIKSHSPMRTPVAPGRGLESLPMKKGKPVPTKELAFYKDLLLKLRDRIIDEISFLSKDSLNRSQRESSGDLSSYSFHMADQGTDNFDREFAANLLSSEQDVLYEIDEAIRRVDAGTYGICEATGASIERERLKVLPFARYCVAAQTEIERGKPRYRPFRRTSIQSLDAQQ